MGVNNRQRRKAKKQKQQRSTFRPAGAGGQPGGANRAFGPDGFGAGARGRTGSVGTTSPFPGDRVDDSRLVDEGVVLAAQAFSADPDGEYPALLEALALIQELTPPGTVHRCVTGHLERCLDMAWSNGWQPADVVRHVRRLLSPKHAAAVAPLVVISGGARPEAAVDERWAAQLVAIAEDAPVAADFGPLSANLALGIEVIAGFRRLPVLPKLSSTTRVTRPAGSSSSVAMLARVRALLAKAESTTFPEEAEALSMKAQELMARHAIDAAMLEAAGHAAAPSAVVGWRIGVDDPYAGAKSMLLGAIARANRCRSVWSKDLGFSTVFGDRADLEMVELLYTSLLVQGTDAMLRAGRSVDRSGASRTRSFRQSFLIAYATRIGERLASAAASAVVEGTERHGDALLPVLTSRAEDVRKVMEETFPRMFERSTPISNYSGWLAGRAAADLASLRVSEQLPIG